MSELKIVTIENDQIGILRKIAERVDLEEIPKIQTLVDNMLETVITIGAIGLAAPQIGISKQIFVLGEGLDSLVCINPVIVGRTGKVYSYAEGCLSIEGNIRFDVKRSREISLRYFDRYGKLQTLRPRKKLLSFAIQHEIDHLNGKLICDQGKIRP
jgi:peptide deformylase